jgi:hypothetical protein
MHVGLLSLKLAHRPLPPRLHTGILWSALLLYGRAMSMVADALSMAPCLWRVPNGGASVEKDGYDVLLPWEIQYDGAATKVSKVRSVGGDRFDGSLLKAPLDFQVDFIHLNHNTESTSDIRDDPDFLADLPSIALTLSVGRSAKPPARCTVVHQIQMTSELSPTRRKLAAVPARVGAVSRSADVVASIDDDGPDEPTMTLSAAPTINKQARRTIWTCMAPDCSYSSARKGNLERHVRNSHTMQRPYACGACAYISADASAVKRHERQHTGESPAICKFPGCDYKAMDFSNLGRHLRVHTGERPFNCPHCPYSSAQSGSISSHVNRRHSTVRAFTCSDCSYAAKTLPDLKKHEIRHS